MCLLDAPLGLLSGIEGNNLPIPNCVVVSKLRVCSLILIKKEAMGVLWWDGVLWCD